MRTIRFLIFVSICTVLALLFVHYQVRIYLLSYEVDKNNLLYEELLDRNEILLYDINRLSSIPRISYKLSSLGDEFVIPDRILRIARFEEKEEKLTEKKGNFLARIFRAITLAEAKEVKK